jgi:hypothetical protein
MGTRDFRPSIYFINQQRRIKNIYFFSPGFLCVKNHSICLKMLSSVIPNSVQFRGEMKQNGLISSSGTYLRSSLANKANMKGGEEYSSGADLLE